MYSSKAHNNRGSFELLNGLNIEPTIQECID